MALLQATYRDAGVVTVLDLSGRITLGEGSALLRSTIRELLDDQRVRILVNLGDINYIDSAGIGELVSAYTAVKNRGGELNLTKKVRDLLQITKLYTVFDVHSDEVTALRSFNNTTV
jgi:anti-sigma B factor antagonist